MSHSTLRPQGKWDFRSKIQRVSRLEICLFRLLPLQWENIFLCLLPEVWLFLLWCNLKCFDKLCVGTFFLSHIRTFNACVVLPTYCNPHVHLRRYTTPIVWHVMNSLLLYCLEVEDEKVDVLNTCEILHILHFLQGKNPFRFSNILNLGGGDTGWGAMISFKVWAFLKMT